MNGIVCNAKCHLLLRVSCQEVEFGVRSHLEDITMPVVLGALQMASNKVIWAFMLVVKCGFLSLKHPAERVTADSL